MPSLCDYRRLSRYYANDTLDGDVTDTVVVGGPFVGANKTKITFATLPLQAVGADIRITYDLADEAGNRAQGLVRRVTIADTTAPVTTLLGSIKMQHEGATQFVDPGIVSNDTYDKDISSDVVAVVTVAKETGNATVPAVNVMSPAGTLYTLVYTSTDSSGNTGTVLHRTVEIIDTTSPVIQLKGEANITWNAGVPFVDPGFSAADTLDGDVTGTVDVQVVNLADGDENFIVDTDDEVGVVFRVTYTVRDTAGNTDVKVRFVELVDTQPPEFTMIGDKAMTQEVGDQFVDPGVIASDLATGVLTDKVRVSVSGGDAAAGAPCKKTAAKVASCIKTSLPAGTEYTITYIVKDAQGLTTKLTRVVTLTDTKPPTVSVRGAPSYSIQPGDPFKLPTCSCTKPGRKLACTNDFVPASLAKEGVVTITFSCKDGQFTAQSTVAVRVTPSSADDSNSDGGGDSSNDAGSPKEPEQIPVTIKINPELLVPSTTAAPVTTQQPRNVVATALEFQLAANATAESMAKLVKSLAAEGFTVYPAATSPVGTDVSELPVVKVLVQGEVTVDAEAIVRSAMPLVKAHTPVPVKHFEGGFVMPGTSASSKADAPPHSPPPMHPLLGCPPWHGVPSSRFLSSSCSRCSRCRRGPSTCLAHIFYFGTCHSDFTATTTTTQMCIIGVRSPLTSSDTA